MTEFKTISVNCRGLGTFKKRKDVFMHLRKYNADVLFLQDVHVARGNENKFRNAWGRDVIVSPFTSNARGVAILSGRTQTIDFFDPDIDPNGNYIICKAKIIDQTYVLVCVYGPNTDSPQFYLDMSDKILEKTENVLPIIMAGDFNLVFSQELDTRNYSRENNVRSRQELCNLMERHDLIDVYRQLNPCTKRFTWRRHGPVIKQARLDFFLLSRNSSSNVTYVDIKPGYRTDHSLITLDLTISNQTRGNGWYKFNVSLLKDISYSHKMFTAFEEVIDQYAAPVYTAAYKHRADNVEDLYFTIDDGLLWETLILKLRNRDLII